MNIKKENDKGISMASCGVWLWYMNIANIRNQQIKGIRNVIMEKFGKAKLEGLYT